MSSSFSETGPGTDPLDSDWYVQGETSALGPFKGRVLKTMIAQREIGPNAAVARVGASEWTPIASIVAFQSAFAQGSGNGAARAARADPNLRYAGFWIRVLAYVIDAVIVIGVSLVVGFVLAFLLNLVLRTDLMQVFIRIYASSALLLSLAYYIYFPSRQWQATPGKRFLGIHVVRLDGSPISSLLALGRLSSYLVSGSLLYVGFMIIGWTKEKRAFHDSICDTRVVYGKL